MCIRDSVCIWRYRSDRWYNTPNRRGDIMPRTSPYVIRLSGKDRKELEGLARRYTSPYRDVIRAKIVLMASDGMTNQEIADKLDMPRQIVSRWRKRFFEQGMPGLEERPRGGRPPVFPPSGGCLSLIHISEPTRLGMIS